MSRHAIFTRPYRPSLTPIPEEQKPHRSQLSCELLPLLFIGGHCLGRGKPPSPQLG